ncbi:MAG: hypothetical protein ACKVT0_18980 [Planctomycetaceae bacterium]
MQRQKRMSHKSQRRVSGGASPHGSQSRGTLRVLSRVFPETREGSTLIIIVALIGALAFLGFFFYTLSAQEEEIAEYYSDGAKIRDAGLDPEILMDHALRQVILGADPNELNSALWGGRQSLLATLFGADNQPFTGQGRNVIFNGSTLPDLDQTYDGTADGTTGLVNVNDSPGAQGSVTGLGSVPAPDVDYTYPDLNNPFLAYRANALDASGNAFQVIIPSYHRPQYLRNVITNSAEWYGDSAGTTTTRNKVLRPHKEHMAVASNGTVTAYQRFVSVANPDTSTTVVADQLGAFPFPDEMAAAADWAEGVWTGDGTTYTLDVDADGDGIKEAIWIDLDYPVQTRSDGTQFVPMFAITIYDADGLINMNTAGNLAGDANLSNPVFGSALPVSRSNQGLFASEVNPVWVLNADPNTEAVGTPFTQYGIFFGHTPADRLEAANMDLWYMLTGKANFNSVKTQGDVNDLVVGRWGELPRLLSVIESTNPYDFPFPGLTGYDDNANAAEGGIQNILALWPSNVVFPAFDHPLDLLGSGRTTQTATFGKTLLLGTGGRMQWRGYMNYASNPQLGWRNVQGGTLMPSSSDDYQTDEPSETVVDPSAVHATDETFSTSENYALHGSSNDTSLTGFSSRLRELATFNLDANTRAAQIRQQLTTDSWDLKSFSKPWYGVYATNDARRMWEFNADTDGDGYLEFPTDFGGSAGTTSDPFRTEVRNALTIEVGDPNPLNSLRKVQRRLSLNGLTELDSAGRLRIRPLTPHPSGLGNGVVAGMATPPIRPEDIQGAGYSIARQEYLARYDRQRLARDIYVMLYALGGGRDDINYTASNDLPASRPVYSDEHLKEMAQYAVNIVDSLDPDDIVTIFEYDRDLANGWSLGDDAYIDAEDDPTAISTTYDERGLVYGVEEQKLTFGEVMALLCKRVEDSTGTSYVNHSSTEYDDQEHRDFLYVELTNVSPRNVDLGSGTDSWQIVVKPLTSATIIEERRLTLTSGTIGTGTTPGFTIGTAGDARNKDVSGVPLPAYMNVDYNWTMATVTPAYTRIAPDPTGSALSLDLIQSSSGYRVNAAPGSTTAFGEGTRVDDDPTLPDVTYPRPGADLLHLTDPVATLDSYIDNDRQIILELRRRANPYRTQPDVPSPTPSVAHEAQSQDNPWVVVDRIQVPLQVFALQYNSEAATIQMQLDEVRSKERFQPLFGGIQTDDTQAYTDDAGTPTPSPSAHVYNSLGNDNGSSAATYSLWQPHLNRDFATALEILTVPVHSPRDTTLYLGSQRVESLATVTTPGLAGWYAGINRLLHPGATTGWAASTAYTGGEEIVPDAYAGEIYRCTAAGTSAAIPPTWGGNTVGDGSVTWTKIPGARANRWSRLLEFFEVPAREGLHEEVSPYVTDLGQIGNSDTDLPVGGIRQPGKINLNTIRTHGVLAALIDDIDVMSINPTGTTLLGGYLPAADGADNRDWWATFIAARDRVDPITGYYLPGVPGTRPFRGLNFSAEGGSSIEHTILRSVASGDGRKLFEIGTVTDHQNSSLDYVNRQRLLTKIAQNSTTRSNVFIVHVQVDFFEAKELNPTTGLPPVAGYTGPTVVRIGAMLPDSPAHRGFYVIDRSRALEMLNSGDLPDDRPTTGAGSVYTYSFNRREDTNGNGVLDAGEDLNANGIVDQFPFRSLVLYRNLIK